MPLSTRRSSVLAAVGLAFGAAAVSGCGVDSSEPVTITVDASMVGRPISPYIYGVSASGGGRPYFKEMGVSVVRWGGNARTRFNWEINASSAGDDWEFRNLEKGDETPGSAALEFHRANAGVDASSLLTVPIIGWVARDKDSDTRSLNVFDDARSMDGYDPTENRQRTSVASFARKLSEFEYPPDLADGVVYQDEWVNFLTQRLGTAEEGGVRFYEMDNEPMLWSETHRDVYPWPVGYDDYFARFADYAAAVKDVDPTAQVLGPSVWGWTAYFYAALDEDDDNYRTADDQKQHGGTPFLPWFLGKVREYDLGRGQRSLDYLSVHYYPQGGVFSDDVSDATQARRLRSTRSLWDPTYKDESWISRTEQGPYVRLIGLLREWIDRQYPGTKLAITEWNWGGEGHISGGLAAAEVLGIFGREGVDLATYWGLPAPGSPVYWAFRMFRNYDGEGRGFGDQYIEAESSRPDSVSAFASIATDAEQLRLLLINKSAEHEREVRLDLRGVDLERDASVYRYAGAAQGIQSLPPLRLGGRDMSYEIPPYSMTMLVADLLDQ